MLNSNNQKDQFQEYMMEGYYSAVASILKTCQIMAASDRKVEAAMLIGVEVRDVELLTNMNDDQIEKLARNCPMINLPLQKNSSLMSLADTSSREQTTLGRMKMLDGFVGSDMLIYN